LRLINLSRYGTTDNGYVVTGTRGATAYTSQADAVAGTNGYESATLSTHQGWQEVEYFGNQLSLLADAELGGMNHEFVFGLTYTDQSVLNGVYSATPTAAGNCWSAGRGGAASSYCILDAGGNEVADVNNLMQRDIQKGDSDSDWNVKSTALSVMDTVDLTDKWTVFGGLRYDYYDYKTIALFDPDGSGPLPRAETEFADKDGFVNGHLGVTYDITPKGNVYLSYATATNINGGESDVGTSCGYGGICVDSSDPDELGNPENTQSFELGTKWLFNDDKLLATAAVFQMTKEDVMEQPTGDSYSTLGSLNTGKNRVQGVEFGLSGNITSKLSAHAGVALMKAEVLDSVNPANEGKTLANFADQTASMQLKYQMTPKFAFGAGATYESERYTGQPDTAANEAMEIPAYTVYDAFASYKVNKNFNLRLNVSNLTDEDYYLAAYRSGSFTYIGDARRASLTAEINF
jgi:catecholate siderophore receptor